MDQSTAVCVIGPGRAGTSVTMGVLALLDVDVGPEDGLVGPGPGGPKGFWERREIIELNDRLLRSKGGSWRRPPLLRSGWEAADDLLGEREHARALLARTFAGSERWGWKDPRVSLTAAFWRDLVPQLRFVICLRSPVDVAASISPPPGDKQDDPFYYARRGPKREQALRLWGVYVASALANTAGAQRLLVSYDGYFDDRRATVERLARFIGRELPPVGGEVERRIDEFVDADLRNHRTSPRAVMRNGEVPREVGSLYLMTELLQGARDAAEDPAGPEVFEQSVDEYAQRLLAARESESNPDGTATSAFTE
jgi:hypothetical protein